MSNYDTLNPMQQEAVFHTEGPVLILAGAGSGKTRVLTHRTAYLIEEKGVNPYHIMAITFTNKAAGEMRERIDDLVGFGSESIWVSTFHSSCVRILRRHIDRLGYDNNFTIYDGDDQKTLMKDICKRLQVDTKIYKEKSFLGAISHAKDELISPEEFALNVAGDYSKKKQAEVYAEYQKMLHKNNALDFDDLIVKTVELLKADPEVLNYYQERFRYIMVDEYQDTNTAQFQLIKTLASKYRNLCVVGDDDQSIYKFRGANIENILSFEKQFPKATVIRLEQNYRCTKTILGAANAVIEHNLERKGKTLWTENESGDTIEITRTYDEQGEASYIAEKILDWVKQGGKFADNAILYRMNAQSNAIEKTFLRHAIPYKIVGGLKFYERKEVKDIVAYLSVLNNPADNLRLRRIINEPKRGIGDATIAAAQQIADGLGVSLFDVIREADRYPALAKKAKVLTEFTGMLQQLMDDVDLIPLDELFDDLLEKSDYRKYLELQGSEGKNRMENVQELKSNIVRYAESAEEPLLSGFLEEIALYTDLDQLDEQGDYAVMMTLHSAKGLEFPNVFIAGMEDGIFPGRQSIGSPSELEEERRLAYVGITRAKKRLYLTASAQRLIFGQTIRNSISRFAMEIPEQYRVLEDKTVVTAAQLKENSNHLMRRKLMVQSGRSLGIGTGTVAQEAPSAKLKLTAGDRVKHKIFGEGTVVSAVPMANDTLVEVHFDKVGTKKIMQNFAKLERI